MPRELHTRFLVAGKISCAKEQSWLLDGVITAIVKSYIIAVSCFAKLIDVTRLEGTSKIKQLISIQA